MRSNGHTVAQQDRLMAPKMKEQNKSIQQILAKHPFFKALEQHHRLFIADCATPVSFEAGTYLAHEGEVSNKFYLILDGRVNIGILTASRGFTTLQTIGRNELVGWSWLMPPHYWHFGARAAVDAETIMFDGQRIREKCEINHDLGYHLMKQLGIVVAERLRITRMNLPH